MSKDLREGMKMKKGFIVKQGAFFELYKLSNQVLGKGSYAEVRSAVEKTSQNKVAVKILQKAPMKKRDVQKVIKEVNILKSVRHPNVVRVFEAFEDKDNFYIVMEFIGGGELFKKIISEDDALPESQIKGYIKTCAEALHHCLKLGVVHRDIKPDNILLETKEKGGRIKIADFNLSKVIEKEEINFTIMETQCGTPNYVAPEVLSGQAYNFKCDIWSLGVVLFVMLSGGYLPFQPDENSEDMKNDLLNEVRKGVWGFEPAEAWADVTPEAKDLVTNMMCKNKEKRFDWPRVLNHKWFKTDTGDDAKPKNLKEMASFTSMRIQMREQLAKDAAGSAAELFADIGGIKQVIPDGSGESFDN